MGQLGTFIRKKFRPEVSGGKLDSGHKTLFYLEHDVDVVEPTLSVKAICFGPKSDNVLINLEHAIRREDQVYIFYYEDIHVKWSYVNDNDGSYFLYKKNHEEQYKIKSANLYIRGVSIEPNDSYWPILGDFFNFVGLWAGFVLCSPEKQMTNESKLFQLNNSLRTAAQTRSQISLGKSYVVKGRRSYNLLNHDKSFIVKSLSGVRSIVVDECDYKAWDLNDISNVPVLFQEKVVGNDVRAHVVDTHIFAKKSNAKLKIDYRYDQNFFKLTDLKNISPVLKNFCLAVAKEEDNELLGIDFIQTESGYVVLEANPSPGWSAYHPYNGIDEEPLIMDLLRVLKNDQFL